MEAVSSLEALEARAYCPSCNAVFRTPFSRCPLDGNKLAELVDDPLIGTTLDNRYEISECIGEGGMGRVYRAKHTRMSRYFAIKVLFGDHAGDTRMRSRFAREAEAVSRLKHGNVIAVVDFGETEGGLLYLVMDLADGKSLAMLVHEEAPLAIERCLGILDQLGRGLSHAHQQGLVHRDFKCENVIMVEEEGMEVPKIVDFGICMITEDSPSNTMLTSNGMVMGTPAVMAPEQASGDIVDHRTDLFSLGIVGYQMLSGCLPFEGTPLDMARKNLYEPIPSIVQRSGVQVPQEIEAAIMRLTAKNPNDRFQTADEFLVAIRGNRRLSTGGFEGVTPIPAVYPELHTPPAGAMSDTIVQEVALGTAGSSFAIAETELGASWSLPLKTQDELKRPAWHLYSLLGLLAVAAAAVLLLWGRGSKAVGVGKSAPVLATGTIPDGGTTGAKEDDQALRPTNAGTETVKGDAGTTDAIQKNSQTDTALLGSKPVSTEVDTLNPHVEPKRNKNKNKQKSSSKSGKKPSPPPREPSDAEKAQFVAQTRTLHAKVGSLINALKSKGVAPVTVESLRSEYRGMRRSLISGGASKYETAQDFSKRLKKLKKRVQNVPL